MNGPAAPMPTQVRPSNVQVISCSWFLSALGAAVAPVPATSRHQFTKTHSSYRFLRCLHPGETARRRDPRLHTGIACLSMKTVSNTCG